MIGGSFVAGDPAAGLPDSPLPALALAGAFVVAAAVVLLGVAAGVGVAAGSASGGGVEASAVAELAASEPDSAVGAEPALAFVGGMMTFSGERAEASAPPTGELAAFPSSAPKPRNTSTRSAEIRGAGSRRPVALATAARASGPVAPALAAAVADAVVAEPAGAAAASPAATPSLRDCPPARAINTSSCGLRDPARAPQLRQ